MFSRIPPRPDTDAPSHVAGAFGTSGGDYVTAAVHDCTFPEVEILEDGNDLRAGMRVLTPCPACGETPLDHLQWMAQHQDDWTRTIATARPTTPLYHWAPTARRKQITRFGLRPFMRATTSAGEGFRHRVVCFADSPGWAWALSGGMRWTPTGEWDLWQTELSLLTEAIILPSPDRASGIYEVRTEHRVYKRDLWLVGSRTKD